MWEEQNKNNISFITEWNLCWKKLQYGVQVTGA